MQTTRLELLFQMEHAARNERIGQYYCSNAAEDNGSTFQVTSFSRALSSSSSLIRKKTFSQLHRRKHSLITYMFSISKL